MKLLVLTNKTTHASFRQRIRVYLDVLHDNDIAVWLLFLIRGQYKCEKNCKNYKKD